MTRTTVGTVPTGIEGFDGVLRGGLERRRAFLVEGRPGVGKTTMALQWLMDGAARGERCLHVSLSETEDELRTSMASHGWSPDHENLAVVTLDVDREDLQRETQNTMYHPSEVELGETVDRILAEVDRVAPDRVVLDSLSEVRLLSQEPLRFRRQILALKQVLAEVECTTILISQELAEPHQAGLHSLVHGVVHLQQTVRGLGTTHRQLQVLKMRGRAFEEGIHDYVVRTGGIRVFPPLSPRKGASYERTTLASGEEALDALLDGGLVRGTSTMFMGPTGTGKSTVANRYVAAALDRGQESVIFTFDERADLLLDRAAGVGLDLHDHVASGRLAVQQIDPGQLSPGEFADRVRSAVERDGRELIVVDSLNGYVNSMPEQRFLLIHLHEVLDYLGSHAVTSILTLTQPGILGSQGGPFVNASYLVDAVLLFRYYEARGEVRKALSVLKKRLGGHEKSIRELRIGSDGLAIGEPLADFPGILSGVPILPGGGSDDLGDDGG